MKTVRPPVKNARFSVGDVIRHQLFEYRGLVVDVDAEFSLTDEWYEAVARSRPPRNEPWYHVLVHGATHVTYVAERNLQADPSAAPILHPLVDTFFTGRVDGRYVRDKRNN